MKCKEFRDTHILYFLDTLADSNKPLDLALSHYFRANKSLGATDRRIIGETLYGMIRWKSLIDFLCPSKSAAKRLECFRQIPWESVQENPSIPEFARFGISEFLYRRFFSIFGAEKTHSLCRLFNTPAPTVLRANLLKTTQGELMKLLSEKFPISPCVQAACGLQLHKRQPLFALSEFKEGFFEIQDEGSQLVASLIEARPGDIILDYCSGSGGKSLAFAPSMERKGQIYLHDIRPRVLLEAKRRLKRAGVQNAQCLSTDHPQLPRLKGKCDWVLIDVPCSGTGTLRRNPDQKWKIDAQMIERLIAMQKEIAKQAAAYLKPDGKLVYATCSLLPEENERQVEFFLTSLPLLMEKEPLALSPEIGGMDGFFAAVFRKKNLC